MKGQRDSQMARLHKKLQVEQASRVFARLADALRQNDHVEEAIDLCHRGLVHHPDYVSGHIVLGQCYLDLGRLAEARDVFLQALVLDEQNVLVLKSLGDILVQQGELKEATQRYRQALKLDRHNADIQEMLREVEEKLPEGSSSAGEEAFSEKEQSAVPYAPSMMEVPVFGKEILEPTDSEEHRHWLREMTRDPISRPRDSDSDADNTMQDVRLSPQESRLLYDKEDEQSTKGPPRGMATATLAEIYFQQGLLDKAIDIYGKVLRHHPDDEKSRARLNELRAMRSGQSRAGEEEQSASSMEGLERTENNSNNAETTEQTES